MEATKCKNLLYTYWEEFIIAGYMRIDLNSFPTNDPH
jgi:hypothetical protein